MSWLSYIFPQTILRTSSKYNQEIRVNKERGKLKLLVNGSRQSGAHIALLWKEVFKEFGLPQSHLQRDPLQILVLGVAGGTVIHLLHSYYPRATIVGVDIDQTMIDIGKIYFGLDQIGELSLICEDAKTAVAKLGKIQKRFDLIIVDLFIGSCVPELVRSETFLQTVKKLLTINGLMVINYLREYEYREKSEQLKGTLTALFSHVVEKAIYNNRFFFVQRP